MSITNEQQGYRHCHPLLLHIPHFHHKDEVAFGGTSVLSELILLRGTNSILFWVGPLKKTPCIRYFS